jgi:hypothetical protein
VEVKLHEEELTMLQQDLDRKTKQVGCLKKELQQKHEQMSEVESLLAKQQDDELMYTYTDGAEGIVLEKHQNDHLKTRLQMEKIDCQIQLTRALLQKKDIESKLEVVKQSLELSEKVCLEAQDLYQRSISASRKSSLVPPSSRMSNRSTSFSSTTSEDSDVFITKSASVSHSTKGMSSSNGCDNITPGISELDVHHRSADVQTKPLSVKKSAATRSPTPNTSTESVVEGQEGTSTTAAYLNVDRKSKGSRPRASALPSGAQRNYRTSSAGSSHSAHHRRCQGKQGQIQRPSHKTQVVKTE